MPAPPPARRPWRRFDALRTQIDRIARKGRQPFFWMLLAVTLALAITLLMGMGGTLYDWLRDPGGEARRIIQAPPDRPPPEAPRTMSEVPAAARSTADQRQEAKPAKPEVDWREPRLIRRAAALLASEGDMNAAISLLLANDHDPAELRQAGIASYAAIDQHLHERLPVELSAIQTHWEALPEAAQRSLYLEPDGGRAVMFSQDLTAPFTPASWQRLTESAPRSYYYALLHNLHVDTVAETGLPASLVAMILATRFLPDERTLALLPPPEEAGPIAYELHAAAYATAIESRLLVPHFARLFEHAKLELLEADEATQAWYELAWSEPFCRLARLLPARNMSLSQQQRAWAALANVAKPCWSRTMYEALVRHYGELPGPVLEAGTWLAPGNSALDKGALLSIARRHPQWLGALRRADYPAARETIPVLTGQLLASGYATNLKIALSEPLAVEEKRFSHPQFPWARLAETIGIRQTIPAGLRDQLADDGPAMDPTRVRYPTWAQAPEVTVFRTLQQLTRRGPRQQREFYEQVADLYALNRGLRQDEAENRQYPQLVPEPIILPQRR